MDLLNGYNPGNVNLNPIPNFNHPYVPMIMVGYTKALVHNLIVQINANELYGYDIKLLYSIILIKLFMINS